MGDAYPAGSSKGDFEVSFSDADSGYEDPGVLRVPATRTLIHYTTDGRKIPTSDRKWICVPRNGSKSSTPDEVSTFRPGEDDGLLNSTGGGSVQSLGTPPFGSDDVLDRSSSSLELLNESGVSSGSNFTMTSVGSEEGEICQYGRERKRKTEKNRKLRLIAQPKGATEVKPIYREISISDDFVLTEETTRRSPRRKGRSKSADGRRVSGPQTLFSPCYTKILSPETMRNRKTWADALKRDCILEQEYYKIPYEECNREIIFGRLCSSETLLNNFRRIKKERSLGNQDQESTLMSTEQRNERIDPLNTNRFNEVSNKSLFKDDHSQNGNYSLQTQSEGRANPLSEDDKRKATAFLKELIKDLREGSGRELEDASGNHFETQSGREDTQEESGEKEFQRISDHTREEAENQSRNILESHIQSERDLQDIPHNYILQDPDKRNRSSDPDNPLQEEIKKECENISENDLREELSERELHNIPDIHTDEGEELENIPISLVHEEEPKIIPDNHDRDETEVDNIPVSPIHEPSLYSQVPPTRSENDFKQEFRKKKRVSFSNQCEERFFDHLESDYDDSSSVSLDDENYSSSVYVDDENDSPYFHSNCNVDRNHDFASSKPVGIHELRSTTPSMLEESGNELFPNYGGFESERREDRSSCDCFKISESNYRHYCSESCNERNDRLCSYCQVRTDDNNNNNNEGKCITIKPATESHKYLGSSPSEAEIGGKNSTQKTGFEPRENHFRGNSANIFMTKGRSFTDHNIHLWTRSSSTKPNVTVRRIKVPFSSLRDEWEFTVRLAREMNAGGVPDYAGFLSKSSVNPKESNTFSKSFSRSIDRVGRAKNTIPTAL